MDANNREYVTSAANAAKLVTQFLKTYGVGQAATAKEMDISFSYLSRMLCGERPFLPKHIVKLQNLTLKAIADHNSHLTGAQVGLLLDLNLAMIRVVITWRKDEGRDHSDTSQMNLVRDRASQLGKLVEGAVDIDTVTQRLNERFPVNGKRETMA